MKTIKLVNGQEAIVDDEDHDWCSRWSWGCSGGYASRRISNKQTISMHRDILQPEDGERIDHINGNKLDNRRSNLRIATQAQNQHNSNKQRNNTSGFKGVSWDNTNGKWLVHIAFQGRDRHVGRFTSAEQAARAYDKKAKELYGEFAMTNEKLGLLD